MKPIVRPVRVAPAFADREAVRALFDENGPYSAAAAYLPDGSDETGESRPADSVLPWFRATWALGGEARIAGAGSILHHQPFLSAARELFPGARIAPKTVVVNLNAPMIAGVPHVDVPSFRGATRERFPLRLLIAMGASGLFEDWRILEAGAIAWFYEGPGGSFDYWPEGRAQPMASERSPFGNVAIVADSDRMWHRIGEVGPPGSAPPRMTAAAQLEPGGGGWRIVDGGQERARYSRDQVRLSLLWKAEATYDGEEADVLTAGRIAAILSEDLRARGVRDWVAAGSPDDEAFIALVYRIYATGRA